MECRQARRKISAYIDSELEAAWVRQLESHLKTCAGCRGVLHEFQGLDDLVRGLTRIDQGPDFTAQMVMKISEIAAAGGMRPQGKLSLLERMSRIAVDFVDLVSSAHSTSTGTLDEFNDFPPLSMGHIYFKLMDMPSHEHHARRI